jgi:hypothetical protein
MPFIVPIGIFPPLNTLNNKFILQFLYSRHMFHYLFVCFESHEQFFSYLATVTITGDRAA